MRALLSWSSGKDSAWALHMLRHRGEMEVIGLFTTINAAFDRVAMHGVQRELVEAQAEAAGLPLHVLEIPNPCPNTEYERVMGAFVAEQVAAGVEAMAFGDLFLEDIRRYREARLAGTGIVPPACHDTMVMVPVNFAGWLWGWPNRFLQRMKDAGSSVILIGPYSAGDPGTSGIDTPEDAALVPDKFPGFVWTNEIATIAPIIKATN